MNVLAVGAHPLDALLLAGGTLARYAAAGHHITLVEVCLPVLDSSDAPVEQLMLKREAATRRAASLIEAEVDLLRLEVCGPRVDNQTRLRFTDVIRRTQPAVIITHDPGDYCDCHTGTSELVADCELMARQPGLKSDHPPLHAAAALIFMDTVAGLAFEPEEFVDITAAFDLKCRMLACHEEEIAAWESSSTISWDELVRVQSRYRGIQAGVRYAEAFRRPRKWGHVRPWRILP